MSIAETLTALAESEDTDTCYILAATLNLYSEVLRRKQGRVLYGPADARRLLELCALFLEPAPSEALTPARGNRLDPDEQEHVLTGIAGDITNEAKAPAFLKRH